MDLERKKSQMAEYFISSNNKYTYEENKYLKNDVVLLDEEEMK